MDGVEVATVMVHFLGLPGRFICTIVMCTYTSGKIVCVEAIENWAEKTMT